MVQGNPKSCDECQALSEMREDPSECFYKTCPFDSFFEHMETAVLYRFGTMCLEKHELPEEGSGGDMTIAKYNVEPQKFQLACRLFWVPDGLETYYSPRLPLIRDQLHAYEFANWMAEALGNAPDARKFKPRTGPPARSGGRPGGKGGAWGKVV